MSNEAMIFTAAVICMLLVFVGVMWNTRLEYRQREREQHIREAELYTKHKP